jgi:hypothetical protein
LARAQLGAHPLDDFASACETFGIGSRLSRSARDPEADGYGDHQDYCFPHGRVGRINVAHGASSGPLKSRIAD